VGLGKIRTQLQGPLHGDEGFLASQSVVGRELRESEPVGASEFCVGGREVRVEHDGPFQQRDRNGIVFSCFVADTNFGAQVELVRRRIAGRWRPECPPLRG